MDDWLRSIGGLTFDEGESLRRTTFWERQTQRSCNNLVFAGPFVGEFGYELFCWQGRLRRYAGKRPVIVACKTGHEYLYQDFASEIISVDVDTTGAIKHCNPSYQLPAFDEVFNRPQYGAKWLKPNEPIVQYVWARHDPTFLDRQSWRLFGQPQAERFDVLLHCRNRNVSQERNWRPTPEFVDALSGLRVATIGSTSDYQVPNTHDLRGKPLEETCNALAGARCLIGPSSGCIHLAALSGCPALTYYGPPYDERNERRYLETWNPYQIGVVAEYVDDWQNPYDARELRKILDESNR